MLLSIILVYCRNSMRWLIKIATTALVLATLSGCGSNPNRDKLQSLKTEAEQCVLTDIKTDRCKQIIDEYGPLYKQARALTSDPQAYGQQILKLQYKISKLKQQFNSSSGKQAKAIKEQLSKYQKELEEHINMVAALESPV